MLRICIRMLPIPFKWFEFAFECFKIPFEWFEFAFECFETLSNGWNLHLNASNHYRIVRIFIRILRITFECLEFNSNASNPFRVVRICIGMLRICIRMLPMPFECFEFAFECFEFAFECFQSLSSVSNLHLNASNPFRVVRICSRML